MKNILIVIGKLFIVMIILVTCNQAGSLFGPKEENEILQKEVLISIEDDLPGDFDELVDSMANDIREYLQIPDTIHVLYGQYGQTIEAFDKIRGANLISSHKDTLFILPIDPGLLKHRVHPLTAHVIGMKIREMVKK